MRKEILTEAQSKLLPIVKLFSKKFGLVGGTAIALHLGHRESIDFDLFSFDGFNNYSIKAKITKNQPIDNVLVNKKGEYTFLINKVKFTFFQFPYKINFSESFGDIVKLPDLLTLAAMKAFALGRRAKWKDYVDLYFIIKEHYSIDKITKKAKQIFDSLVKRINTNIDMLCDNTDILENIYKKKSDREFARECMKEGSYQLVEAMILENK